MVPFKPMTRFWDMAATMPKEDIGSGVFLVFESLRFLLLLWSSFVTSVGFVRRGAFLGAHQDNSLTENQRRCKHCAVRRPLERLEQIRLIAIVLAS